MHSHIGVDSLPELSGADDVNSVGNQVNPWLRSLDAINTHDLSYRRTVSGGVTTSLVLPGSANSIVRCFRNTERAGLVADDYSTVRNRVDKPLLSSYDPRGNVHLSRSYWNYLTTSRCLPSSGRRAILLAVRANRLL